MLHPPTPTPKPTLPPSTSPPPSQPPNPTFPLLVRDSIFDMETVQHGEFGAGFFDEGGAEFGDEEAEEALGPLKAKKSAGKKPTKATKRKSTGKQTAKAGKPGGAIKKK